MCRAALPQVHLDGGGPPLAPILARGHEVEGEPPEHPLAGEPCTDLLGVAADLDRVPGVGRKPAADVRLPARAAQELVVRREDLHLAERRHPQLDAGTAKLVADEAVPPRRRLPGPAPHEGLVRQGRQLELHLAESSSDRPPAPPGHPAGKDPAGPQGCFRSPRCPRRA